jgi:hypothetical protein
LKEMLQFTGVVCEIYFDLGNRSHKIFEEDAEDLA